MNHTKELHKEHMGGRCVFRLSERSLVVRVYLQLYPSLTLQEPVFSGV